MKGDIKMKSSRLQSESGFTLIELLVVVAILVFWQLSPFLNLQHTESAVMRRRSSLI